MVVVGTVLCCDRWSWKVLSHVLVDREAEIVLKTELGYKAKGPPTAVTSSR